MPLETSLLSVFLAGLLGSAHCLGMCGGIVGALTLGLPESIRRSPVRLLPYLIGYNSGRIASYTLAGALAGLIGGPLLNTLPQAQRVGIWIAGLFMIALGLYLGDWWRGLLRVEQIGARLWQAIEPLGRRLLPVRHPWQALGVGAVWGWLPCGVVYAVLVWALTSGSAANGALLMLVFGLGTLPMLLMLGAAAHWLLGFTRRIEVRRAAGLLIILFGFYTLAGAV